MSTKTKQNEKSWSIQLIKMIETYSKKLNYVIKKAGGEETISKNKKKMFPDVLLLADDKGTAILQGWELKMPDVSIFDENFIQDAWRKADLKEANEEILENYNKQKDIAKEKKKQQNLVDFIEGYLDDSLGYSKY